MISLKHKANQGTKKKNGQHHCQNNRRNGAPGMSTMTMDGMRNGLLGKVTAGLTTALFTFVFYLSPTGSAMAQETPEDQRQAEIEAIEESTPSKKLAHRLGKLQKKVTRELPASRQQREEEAGFIDTLLGNDDDPVTSGELDEISVLKTEIEAAYAEAIAEMDELGSWLVSKNMSQQALDRHQTARDQISSQYTALMADVQSLLNATTEEEQDMALQVLDGKLRGQRVKRPSAPFDPDKLPVNIPDHDTREPAEDTSQLLSYLGINPFAAYLQVAATQMDPQLLEEAFSAPNGPTEADLEHTTEAPLTDEIANLAAELNHNPVDIYTWVHNNIRYIPSYGSIQGAQMTLEAKRGNAMDTASLLIALLRASGIPARYAYGSVNVDVDKLMNWVGGVKTPAAAGNLMGQGGIPNVLVHIDNVPTHFRIEHTWVEAYVDFEPSRGTRNKYGDHWIAMDPSFKQYEFVEGLDLQTVLPFDAQSLVSEFEAEATVNDTEGWVQNVPHSLVSSRVSDYQDQVNSYASSQDEGIPNRDILGAKDVILKEAAPLSAGLPYGLVTRSQFFSAVPQSLKHKVRLRFWGSYDQGSTGGLEIDITKSVAELAGKRLQLEYHEATPEDEQLVYENFFDQAGSLPTYLVNVIPTLELDGEVIAQAGLTTMGDDQALQVDMISPEKSTSSIYGLVAGDTGVLSISSGAFNDAVYQKRSAAYNLADTELPNYLSEMYHQLMLAYWVEVDNFNTELATQAGIVHYGMPSHGMMVSPLTVNYWFGIPRDGVYENRVIDVKLLRTLAVDESNNTSAAVDFIVRSGMAASGMESGIWEYAQLVQRGVSVSAVSALQMAIAEGQRIYQIDYSNLEQALSAIDLEPETEQSIREAVYAGREVTTHSDLLSVSGFVGSGYIVLDPNTGSGAYMISGGLAGGSAPGPHSTIPLPEMSDIGAMGLIIGRLARFSGGAMVASSAGSMSIATGVTGVAVGTSAIGFIIALLLFIALIWLLSEISEMTEYEPDPWYLRRYGNYARTLSEVQKGWMFASEVELDSDGNVTGIPPTFGTGVYVAHAETEQGLGIGCPITFDDSISVAERYQIPNPSTPDPGRIQSWLELEIDHTPFITIEEHTNSTGTTEVLIKGPLWPVSFIDPVRGEQEKLAFVYGHWNPNIRYLGSCL